jgi:ribulose-5-phosphate 4-epimerase/fuculose-1-phosphate aldolase
MLKTVSRKKSIVDEIVAAARYCGTQNLVRAGSGNISCRKAGSEKIFITTSGTWLSAAAPDDIMAVSISGVCERINSSRPSTELPLHLGIYRAVPECNAVLHFQSDYATVLSCTKNIDKIDFNVTPEIPAYISKISSVKAYVPGSSELAESVSDCASIDSIIIMKNHGLIAAGRNIKSVITMALFFELACKIIVLGKDPARISSEVANDIRKKYHFR